MRRRVRAAFTYSNVVATLSLFIVLGGGAYAATSGLIDGREIKSHSISGAKLKNNTLTGRQIKESKLGRVPDAAKLAGRPATAYQPAGSYLAAGATAANAAKLGGKDPSAYVGAERIVAGSGVTSATTPQTVLTYPRLGLTVTTDGDADTDQSVRFVNDGTARLEVSQSYASVIPTLSPGATALSDVLAGANGRSATYVVRQGTAVNPGDPTIALVLTCGWDFSPDIVNCAGIGVG